MCTQLISVSGNGIISSVAGEGDGFLFAHWIACDGGKLVPPSYTLPQIRCCGSSVFLKNRYGVGYTMTMSKLAGCSSDSVVSLVHQHVPEAEVTSDVAGELSLRLPFSGAPKFPDLFDGLDESMGELKVESYGISVTTLEEVFLRVGREAEMPEVRQDSERHLLKHGKSESGRGSAKGGDVEMDVIRKKNGNGEEEVEGEEGKVDLRRFDADLYPDSKPTGFALFSRHFRVLFWKRFLNAKRDKKVGKTWCMYNGCAVSCGVCV